MIIGFVYLCISLPGKRKILYQEPIDFYGHEQIQQFFLVTPVATPNETVNCNMTSPQTTPPQTDTADQEQAAEFPTLTPVASDEVTCMFLC